MDSKKGGLSREDLAAQVFVQIVEKYMDESMLSDTLLVGSATTLLPQRYPDATLWNTVCTPLTRASPLPAATGTYQTIILRLPKSHLFFDFFLRSLCYYARPDTRLLVYGFNDEGIKGAQKKLEEFFGNCVTLDYKKRCRVLSTIISSRTITQMTRKPLSLDLFMKDVDIAISPGVSYSTIYYPSMFAHGVLDAGTAFLLTHCPTFSPRDHVLDYACGSGIIARHCARMAPEATWDLLDHDTLSLAAARENCARLHVKNYILGDHLPADKKYDHIISNPPMHTEKEEHTSIIDHLIVDAPRHLNPGGSLTIVVQSRLPLSDLFAQSFHSHTQLAKTSQFTVWHGTL